MSGVLGLSLSQLYSRRQPSYALHTAISMMPPTRSTILSPLNQSELTQDKQVTKG